LNHAEARLDCGEVEPDIVKIKDPQLGFRNLLSSSSTSKLVKTKKESMSAADLVNHSKINKLTSHF